VGAPLGAGGEALGKRALASPLAELELAFEEEADICDRLDVADETVVGLPGAKARAGDARAAARQPDERRQLDREARGLRPPGIAPAVAQAARCPVAATDQDGELVERDRVLLRDEAEQLPVPVGDLVAAPVPPWCSPGRPLFVEDRVRLFLQLDHSLRSLCWSLRFWCWCVLPLPTRSHWASLPWWVTSFLQTVFSSEVEGRRSRTRRRRRSERQRRPSAREHSDAGAHTLQQIRTNGRPRLAGQLPGPCRDGSESHPIEAIQVRLMPHVSSAEKGSSGRPYR